MKTIFYLLFCLAFFIQSNAQDITTMIKGIHNAEQAWKFIKAHPNLHGEVVDFKSFTDSSDFARQLYQQKRGTTLKKDNFTYKVLWDTVALFSKVSYIYLSGDILTKKQIDSLRDDIIDQYNKGTPFENLASIYSMDGNKTGELDWFLQGNMAPEFVDAINSHAKDEMFLVDMPLPKWYYVVKKTYDSKNGQEVVVLKLQTH